MDDIPEYTFKIEKTKITAKSRKLKASWSLIDNSCPICGVEIMEINVMRSKPHSLVCVSCDKIISKMKEDFEENLNRLIKLNQI